MKSREYLVNEAEGWDDMGGRDQGMGSGRFFMNEKIYWRKFSVSHLTIRSYYLKRNKLTNPHCYRKVSRPYCTESHITLVKGL